MQWDPFNDLLATRPYVFNSFFGTTNNSGFSLTVWSPSWMIQDVLGVRRVARIRQHGRFSRGISGFKQFLLSYSAGRRHIGPKKTEYTYLDAGLNG